MNKLKYCKSCGKTMVRGKIEEYDGESGKPYYYYDCPDYWTSRLKFWKQEKHYYYSERDNCYYSSEDSDYLY